jgi:hypothetical protein
MCYSTMGKFVIITMKEDRNTLTRPSVDQAEASISRSLSETESVSDPVDLQLEQEPPGGGGIAAKKI